MLKIYNTLTKKKEIFKPLKNKKINLFVCGPTVYDLTHLGHAKTYINFDVISDYFRDLGYNVFYLQNITDIDDKIIKRAKEKKCSLRKISKHFEKEYRKDMRLLKIKSVNRYAPATKHIKQIQSQIERLLEKGYAYIIKDGVYYDVKKFKDYGKLARRKILRAKDAISRIDENKEKRNQADFCLWKFSKKNEPKWKSPWGYGRPGWHIEDTAISEMYFGSNYEIHGGARELIFPHHEAEIAQMEAISGKKPMVKYWLHTGILTINGQKMSKSLRNFITIREFLKDYNQEILRIFILSSHYRSSLDYSQKTVNNAFKKYKKISDYFKKLSYIRKYLLKKEPAHFNRKVLKNYNYFLEFKKSINNDFNTPKAFAVIFKLINQTSASIFSFNEKEIEKIYHFFLYLDKVFKILPSERIKIPLKIKKLLTLRKKFRKENKWKEADKIRKEIEKLGYKVEDTQKGQIIF